MDGALPRAPAPDPALAFGSHRVQPHASAHHLTATPCTRSLDRVKAALRQLSVQHPKARRLAITLFACSAAALLGDRITSAAACICASPPHQSIGVLRGVASVDTHTHAGCFTMDAGGLLVTLFAGSEPAPPLANGCIIQARPFA